MREFVRLKNVAKGDAKELRQTSIVQYTAPPATVKPTKKPKDRDPLAGAPSLDCWRVQGAGALRKATWDGPPSPPIQHESESLSRVLTLED